MWRPAVVLGYTVRATMCNHTLSLERLKLVVEELETAGWDTGSGLRQVAVCDKMRPNPASALNFQRPTANLGYSLRS